MLMKNHNKVEDMHMAILVYRSTPLENGSSPAELLMNRKLRTTVPMIPQELKPKLLSQTQLRKKEKENRKKQKRYYDKCHHARRLPTLKPGEIIWVPATKKTAKVLKNEVFVHTSLELLMGSHTVEKKTPQLDSKTQSP